MVWMFYYSFERFIKEYIKIELFEFEIKYVRIESNVFH